MIEDDLFELLVYLFLLPKYYVAFTFDCLGLQLGVLEDVGKDVNGGGNVGIERFGIVDSILTLDTDELLLQCIAVRELLPMCTR